MPYAPLFLSNNLAVPHFKIIPMTYNGVLPDRVRPIHYSSCLSFRGLHVGIADMILRHQDNVFKAEGMVLFYLRTTMCI